MMMMIIIMIIVVIAKMNVKLFQLLAYAIVLSCSCHVFDRASSTAAIFLVCAQLVTCVTE